MLSDGVLTIQTEVLSGKDTVASGASLNLCTDLDLAGAFCARLKALRVNGTKLLDAIRSDEEMQAILAEFRIRMWERAEESSVNGSTCSVPPDV